MQFPRFRQFVLIALPVGLLVVLPGAAQADFGATIPVTASGADPFGYPSDIGFDQTGGLTVETVSGGHVLAYARPAGASSFSGGSIGTGTKASMAVAADGTAVTVWRQSATTVQVDYRASGAGAFASAASFPGSAVGNVAAGIDANGNAVVVWLDGGIHYALSTGASFGAAQTAPLGASPSFNGRGSDAQRDHGPRAFRDNSGNVVLAYRDGANATLAERAPDGTWTGAVLPGGASSDLQADADPTSERLIVGYTTTAEFQVFEGATFSTVGAIVVDQPASNQNIMSVAVQRGGPVDLALWRDNTNALRSASCLDSFTPGTVGPSVGAGVVGAVSSGGDLLAYYAASPGLQRGSRLPNQPWTNTPYTVTNFGTLAAGAGYNGDAFGLFVDYPSDTAITGFPYSGAAMSPATCISPAAANTPTPPPNSGQRLSASYVACDLFNPDLPSAVFQCTADVGDASGNPTIIHPSGTAVFSINKGGGGSFGGARTVSCSLTPSQTGGNSSFCSVNYTPPAAGIPIGSQPPITMTYAGDTTFSGSNAVPRSRFSVCPPDLGSLRGGTARAVAQGVPPPVTQVPPTPPCSSTAALTFDKNATTCDQAADPLNRHTRSAHIAVATNPSVQFNVSQDSWGTTALKVPIVPIRALAACAGGLLYGAGSVVEAAGNEKLVTAQAAVGSVMAVTGATTPVPGANLSIAGAGAIVTLSAGIQYVAANTIAAPLQSAGSTLINDPPDRHFRSIPVIATVPGIPLAAHAPAVLRDLATFAVTSKRLRATNRAMQSAVNRAGGAKAAHSRSWQGRQIRAGLGFGRTAVAQLKTLIALQPRLAREVKKVTAAVKPLTAAQIAKAKRSPAKLSAATTALLKAFGITPATLRANVKQAVAGAAVPQGLQVSPFLSGTMHMGIAVIELYARVPQIKTEAALK